MLIASAHGTPALGSWHYSGEVLTLVEEGLPHQATVLQATPDTLAIRMAGSGPAGGDDLRARDRQMRTLALAAAGLIAGCAGKLQPARAKPLRHRPRDLPRAGGTAGRCGGPRGPARCLAPGRRRDTGGRHHHPARGPPGAAAVCPPVRPQANRSAPRLCDSRDDHRRGPARLYDHRGREGHHPRPSDHGGFDADPRQAAGPGSPPALAGARRLEDLAGTGVIDDALATLEFTEAGRVSGRGSCNQFSGPVAVTGSRSRSARWSRP